MIDIYEKAYDKLYKENQEKDKEIERLRKREKKWEKWTTEKEILSTKMSEYLCKWKNIKREYKNQVESNRLKKQKIERLNNIIDKLEKWISKEQKRYREYLSERATNDSEYNSQYATQCGLAQLDVVLDRIKALKEGKE